MRGAPAALLLAACATPPRPFPVRPLQRLGAYEPARVLYGKAVRGATLFGPGRVTFDTTVPDAKLQVFAETGGLPLAEGPSAVSLQLPAAATCYFLLLAPSDRPGDLRVAFVPDDPDGRSGTDATQAGATTLIENDAARGKVDFEELDRTDWFRFAAPRAGKLAFTLKREDTLHARVVLPDGSDRPFGHAPTIEVNDAAAGDYFVEVQALPGGPTDYALTAAVVVPDPDAASGADVVRSGANPMSFSEGPHGLRAEARDDVDAAAGDATDWFVFGAPMAGRCAIVLKPVDRAAHVRAELFRPGRDEGERIRTGFVTECGAGDLWVKVFAEPGHRSKYRLEVEMF